MSAELKDLLRKISGRDLERISEPKKQLILWLKKEVEENEIEGERNGAKNRK